MAEEPTFILIPNRVRDRGGGDGIGEQSPPIGPCTSLTSLSSHTDDWIASGHLNGWIVLWSLQKRRSTRQWLGHYAAQVSTLQYWHRDVFILISHGRDGFIRFWQISSIYPTDRSCTQSPPKQCLTEIRTCEFTFCHFSFWSASNVDVKMTDVHYLAHISSGEDEPSGFVKGTDIEVIRLPDNVIVVNTSVGVARSNAAGLTNLGLCMALQGITQSHNKLPSCLLLAAFESGHILLFGNGKVITRLNSALGEAIPIMSMAILTNPDTNHDWLIALGGPNRETSAQSVQTLGFVRLKWNQDSEIGFQFISAQDKLSECLSGVSSLTWRSDARLLAVGQWNGEIRLVQTFYRKKWRFRHLGWLASLGAIDSGELLGEWTATTVKQPHGPIIDQQSTTVRGLLFTPESHWLISTAPASAGAIGSLLVWNVYRATESQQP